VDLQKLVPALVEWLRSKVAEARAEGLVLGLSGGIDSAVAAALCKQAFPQRSLGVIMPCYSIPQDADDARLVAEHLGLETRTVVLNDVFTTFLKQLSGETYSDSNKRDLAVANIKPRLRMTTLYFFAARYRYLVVGTGNRSEIMIGYYTKYGDGGVDLLPLASLLKAEVKELARYLGLPRRVIEKAPSAGLWDDHNDEAELGITYEELDDYLESGTGSDRVRRIVNDLIKRSQHKRELPPIPPF
jgi:NAD+ synthase